MGAARLAQNKAVDWTEQGLVPDSVIRHGIRRLVKKRLSDINADDCEIGIATLCGFVDMMRSSPIALVPDKANEQHYEVPAAFFEQVLGPRRKYSCCYWPEDIDNLESAEEDSLRLTCTRAAIEDGHKVLDLGCGWGSLSLYIAERFPASHVTSVTNSNSQKQAIMATAKRRGLANVQVIDCDMNDFEAPQRFDRVVSVEMFEHMRNYERLFERIASWLVEDGLFFMHIFCHRDTPYEFIDKGPGDWMTRYFFTGGIMPSDDLPLFFQKDLLIEDRWRWDGTHYARTCNAWLEKMDRNEEAILQILGETYGAEHASTWFMRWRMFFMACAELFDFDAGQQWFVGHYLFSRRMRAFSGGD